MSTPRARRPRRARARRPRAVARPSDARARAIAASRRRRATAGDDARRRGVATRRQSRARRRRERPTDARARARADARADDDDDDDDDATIGLPSFTPSTSDAAGCLTALEDVSPSLRVLGAMSFVVSTLIGAPQAYKIYARKSSRGVSFWTLALGNVGGFLCVLNLYVLHYDQIKLSGNAFADFKGWARATAEPAVHMGGIGEHAVDADRDADGVRVRGG